MREPLAVREKPRFNRAHRDAEAQIWSWVQQPGSAERRRAIKVPIEIDKYDPGRVLCSRVITANSLLQKRLALLAIYGSGTGSGKEDQSAYYRLVHDALHRGGDGNAVRHYSEISKHTQLLRVLRPRSRYDGFCERRAALEQLRNFGESACRLYLGAFSLRPQQQHLVEPYPFVPQKVWRMGTQNNLSSGATLHACEHRRQVAHDLGMKRQFRFFEQKRSAAFHRNPQQAHEPQSAVGELFLGLPCALGPPVLILSAQVWCTAIVT